jgi:hypothetical protein
MTSTTLAVSSPPGPALLSTTTPRARALPQLAPMLAAVPRHRVRRVHIAPIRVVSILSAFAPRIASLRELIASSLPTFDLAHVDNLPLLARGLREAHTALELCERGDPDLPRLAAIGFELRRSLVIAARALVAHRYLDARPLKHLHRPSGYVHLAADLDLLAEIFRQAWPRIRGKTAITLANLHRAETLAFKLSQRGGARRRTPLALREARDRRARAFTLAVTSYEEARAAVQFLRRAEGDADHFAPPLVRRKRPPRPRNRPRVSLDVSAK